MHSTQNSLNEMCVLRILNSCLEETPNLTVFMFKDVMALFEFQRIRGFSSSLCYNNNIIIINGVTFDSILYFKIVLICYTLISKQPEILVQK